MPQNNELTFKVSKVCQSASGGSYVVKLKARLRLLPDDPQAHSVFIESTIPVIANEQLRERGQQAVAQGAAKALDTINQGYYLNVTDFVIHPVDFKPSKIEYFTEKAVAIAIQGLDLSTSREL